MAKIKGKITTYKGRYCAELVNGDFMLSDGSMEMMLCEKVPQGFKVKQAGIVGGIVMRTEEDFRWCVEHYNS